MNWKHHYAGIDIAEMQFGPVNLYLNRENDQSLSPFSPIPPADRYRNMLSFARLTIGRRFTLGIFLGKLNYLPGSGGFEVFTHRYSFGWIGDITGTVRVRWSGSRVDPYHGVGVRVGHIGFALHKSGVFGKMKERRERARMEAYAANFPDFDEMDFSEEDGQ